VRKFATLLSTVIFALIYSVGTTLAAPRTVEVAAGKKTLIYQYGVYLTSCGHAAYPTFSSRGSKNGTVTSTNGSFIMQEGACKGKRLKSTNVYYTPKPGFRGKDKVNVVFGTPIDSDSPWGTKYKRVNFSITVK